MRWLVLGLLSAAVLLGGCGDDEDGSSSTSTSDSSTSDSTTDSTSTSTSGSTSEPSTSVSASTTSTTGSQLTTVEVFFSVGDGSDCSEVRAFPRDVAPGADPIRSAFDQLVSGPTDTESDAGAGSFFSAQTTGTVDSTTLTDGLLVVDFNDLRPLIPNASTSCGSEALLSQLDSTGFQFELVERIRYEIEGSCDAFAEWLQRECFEIDSNGRRLTVATNERASGSGCTPPGGSDLPDGRWYGLVAEAEVGQVSFDLACWFTGSAAAAAASEDGEESPPPNDFHVRNESDRLRTLAVEEDAAVSWLPDPGDPATEEATTYDVWRIEQPGRAFTPGVWLTVEDGAVVAIEEQYVP